jgi:hypothetical protein
MLESHIERRFHVNSGRLYLQEVSCKQRQAVPPDRGFM